MRKLAISVLLLALLVPATARADSGSAVVSDCIDNGQLTKKYTQKQLSSALDNLPTDVDEYSNCRDIIRQARLRAAAGGGSSPGSGGGGTTPGAGGGAAGGGGDGTAGGAPAVANSSPAASPLNTATPAERTAFEKAVQAGDEPIVVDGTPVSPTSLGGATVTGIGDVPTPLLIVLLLMVAAAGAAAVLGAQRIVNSRRAR